MVPDPSGLTTHIHLIILISVRFIFNSCSTFIGQISLPCIRQLLTQVAYTLPFSFNENPFPVRMGIHKTFSKQIWLCLLLLNHIIHLHQTYLPNNTLFIYLFQRCPITSIHIRISIKPICDWSIYLTASADERLAYITQTSFHSTTSFMNPFRATMAQNWIIANSLLTYTTGPLTFLFHLIFHTTTDWTLPSFFSCIHLQTFCFQPWFPFYYLIT